MGRVKEIREKRGEKLEWEKGRRRRENWKALCKPYSDPHARDPIEGVRVREHSQNELHSLPIEI